MNPFLEFADSRHLGAGNVNFARSVPEPVLPEAGQAALSDASERGLVTGAGILRGGVPRLDKKTIDYNALAMLLQLIKRASLLRTASGIVFILSLCLRSTVHGLSGCTPVTSARQAETGMPPAWAAREPSG